MVGESGEPLEQYCERTGKSAWTPWRWRREHAEHFGIAIKRRPGARGRARGRADAAPMIPVQIVAEVMTAGAPMTVEA
jgi:hypothetical protein